MLTITHLGHFTRSSWASPGQRNSGLDRQDRWVGSAAQARDACCRAAGRSLHARSLRGESAPARRVPTWRACWARRAFWRAVRSAGSRSDQVPRLRL